MDFGNVGINIAMSVIGLFAVPLLTRALVRLIHTAADRMKIQFSAEQDQQIGIIALQAVTAAEEWAAAKVKSGQNVSSAEKLSYAIQEMSGKTKLDAPSIISRLKSALFTTGLGASSPRG